MPRSRHRRLIPAPVLLGWNAAAALTVPVIGFAFTGHTPLGWEFGKQFLIAFCYTNCISGMFYVLMPYWMPLLMSWRSYWKWPAILAFKCSLAIAGTALGSVVLTAVGLVSWGQYWPLFRSAVFVSLAVTLTMGSAISAYHIIRYRLEDATLALRTRELERERTLQQTTQARLAALESRVHPHFLFNALNSITSLIREDPIRAERLLIRMAALLRFSLDASQHGLVPLSQEMKIVEDYLEIEKARFGGRLEYRLMIGSDMAMVEVPPLSVQTLVENSVKYAVGPRREGGRIEVRAEWRDGLCWIAVDDDGPGFADLSMPAGHGLENLQARLQNHFGERGQLRIDCADGLTRVSVAVPAALALAR